MNNSKLSFTAVLYDGSMKEYKSGEEIRDYYAKDEVYKVFMWFNGERTDMNLDTIFNAPKNVSHLVNGGLRSVND